jgi:site-specific recombinase XerD
MTDDRPTLRSELDLFDSVLADRKRSPRTIQTYRAAVERLADWCEAEENNHSIALADIDITALRAFRKEREKTLVTTSMAVEHRSLQAFWKWATTEPTLDRAGPDGGPLRNPMTGLDVPQIISQPRTQVTDEQHQIMLRMVALEENPLAKTRGEAILRLFHDTGARLSEIANLKLTDVDLKAHEIEVTGKGGRRRRIPFRTKAHLALVRYIKLRSRSRDADLEWLWVGARHRMTKWGIGAFITETAKEAKLNLSPHAYRHAFAADYLASGGEEGDLMQLGGWKSRDMIQRVYGRQTAEQRAKDNYRRLYKDRD